MASTDWQTATSNSPGSAHTLEGVTLASGGGSSAWEIFDNSVATDEWYLYQHNAGSLQKYIRMGAAVRGEGLFPTQIKYGLGFFGALQSGNVSTAVWDGFMCGFNSQETTGGPTLRAMLVNNGTVFNSGSSFVIPVVSNGYVQYEVAWLLNDKFIEVPDMYRIVMYCRWNTGTSLSVPGSNGDWTTWNIMGTWNINNADGPHQACRTGVYPSWGYGDTSGFGGGATNTLHFDHITLQYGTEIVP